MITPTDAIHMADAIRLAEKGQYSTHPNPCVGSVIVNGDKVVGRGYHIRAGEGHAEVHALKQAGASARGATVYCTLEPCSFHGRTPSCAQTLIEAGVARVVVGMVDPDPRNAGKGLQMLRDAGIEVECPLMEASANALNPGLVKRCESGLPFVRLKLAMTLDGKTALASGESKWITSEASRRDVQKLRARSAAIVTGVQTVIDDDPRLNVREDEVSIDHADVAASVERPIVVLDSQGRAPAHAKLMGDPHAIFVGTSKTLPEKYVQLPGDRSGQVDLRALLSFLADKGLNEVLFECGPTLGGSLVSLKLVDEIWLYVAPNMLGADARSLLNLAKIDSMHDRLELEVTDARRVGPDLRIICVPK